MKVLVALLALVAVAYSERLCRSNCQSTDNFDDLTSNGCQCDDACVDANDCCDSYFDFCVEDAGCRNNCGSDEQSSDANGRCFCDDTCEDADDCCSNYAAECGGETDDTACQGCPDGAQTSTSGSARGSCYCDAACVDSNDCCPSFTKYCGDAIVSESRQSFCALLTSSKSVFCDTVMRKAYYFKVVPKIDTTFPNSGPPSDGWALDTYNRTCLREPEIVEDEAVTCETIRDFTWQYGCTGLNSVWAQRCDSTSCRNCDNPWRRDYWGATTRIIEKMDPNVTDSNHPEFPASYGPADEYGVASQAGRCQMEFTLKCVDGELPEDSDRASAKVFGCLDTTYDADDVKFLDWEKAYSSSTPWTGYGEDAIVTYGNGDSVRSQIDQIARVWTASTGYDNQRIKPGAEDDETYLGLWGDYIFYGSFDSQSPPPFSESVCS